MRGQSCHSGGARAHTCTTRSAKPKHPFFLRFRGIPALQYAIMRLVGWKTRSVAERYIGATTSQSNPEARRVKTRRGRTVAYDTQRTKLGIRPSEPVAVDTGISARFLPHSGQHVRRGHLTTRFNGKNVYHEGYVEHTRP